MQSGVWVQPGAAVVNKYYGFAIFWAGLAVCNGLVWFSAGPYTATATKLLTFLSPVVAGGYAFRGSLERP